MLQESKPRRPTDEVSTVEASPLVAKRFGSLMKGEARDPQNHTMPVPVQCGVPEVTICRVSEAISPRFERGTVRQS